MKRNSKKKDHPSEGETLTIWERETGTHVVHWRQQQTINDGRTKQEDSTNNYYLQFVVQDWCRRRLMVEGTGREQKKDSNTENGLERLRRKNMKTDIGAYKGLTTGNRFSHSTT
ncbi:hypothetical protein ACJMK2_013907 [Sinanodonta woodiana]|uniref:Uncharacterized protein n=1 Tax=Sinanodonta woodiana TaxID=1069815 RepID=A0ABD3UYX7_SINWO